MNAEHVVVPRFPTTRELQIVAALERLGATVAPDPVAKARIRERVLAARTAPQHSRAS